MSNLKTILLKFAGPLQSWGTDSNFESRYTDYYPSKSAVIGMVAASLGYRRVENEKIQKLNDLDFAVRIDQKGKLLKDYQIAKKYKDGVEERTYVTNRYYLEDAIFIVALSGKDEIIDTIFQALRNPYFQQFMGRRSVPPTADFIIGINRDNAFEALKNLEWQAADWYKKRFDEKKSLEVYLDANLSESGLIKYRKDFVDSFSQKDRRFNIRAERRVSVNINYIKKTNLDFHDAFNAIGGSDVSIKS